MSLTQLELSGSYRQQLSGNNFLMIGAMIGGMQRAFETDQLRWDIQFDGKVPDFSIDPGENFDDLSRFMFDFSAGLNWHLQGSNTKTRIQTTDYGQSSITETFSRPSFSLDLGGAIYHLNRPVASFFDNDDVKLRSRISLYGVSAFRLSERFDLVVEAMAQFQGVYREVLLYGAGRIYLDPDPKNLLALQLGLSGRFGDSFAPAINFLYKDFRFGFSYDINTSDFNIATNRNGGPEFSFRYIFQGKEKDCGGCLTCPKYL